MLHMHFQTSLSLIDRVRMHRSFIGFFAEKLRNQEIQKFKFYLNSVKIKQLYAQRHIVRDCVSIVSLIYAKLYLSALIFEALSLKWASEPPPSTLKG